LTGDSITEIIPRHRWPMRSIDRPRNRDEAVIARGERVEVDGGVNLYAK
jgi:hypothetical protein